MTFKNGRGTKRLVLQEAKTPAGFLRQAKKLIETFGWTRHTYGNTNVGFCLTGAMYNAPTVKKEVFAAAADAMRQACGMESFTTVLAWNDNPTRRKRQVLAAFDRGIKAAR